MTKTMKTRSQITSKGRKGETTAKKTTKVKTTTKGKTKNSTKTKQALKQEPLVSPSPLPIYFEKKHETITNLLYQIDEQILDEVWCCIFGYFLDDNHDEPDLDAVSGDIGEVIDALADEAYEVIRDEDVDGLTKEALLEVLSEL